MPTGSPFHQFRSEHDTLRFSLLAKASTSLLTLSGFGGGGVGQKFKPLLNKSFSERVSSNVDRSLWLWSLTIWSNRALLSAFLLSYSDVMSRSTRASA